MADRTVHLWECDRCLAEETGDELAFQPKEWICVRIATPPKATDPHPVATLCVRCAGLLNRWLLGEMSDPQPHRDPERIAERVAPNRPWWLHWLVGCDWSQPHPTWCDRCVARAWRTLR